MKPTRFVAPRGPFSKRPLASRLLLAGAVSLLSACGQSEEPQTFTAQSEQELEQLMPMLRPGDLLRRGDLSVQVPPAGEGRYVEVLYADGHSEELILQTETGGKVALVHGIPSAPSRSAQAVGACADGAYTLSGPKWTQPLRWTFNAGTTPPELTVDAAEAALRAAASNITTGNNDCGLAGATSARHEYQGRAARTANSCDGQGDGLNAVGFGDIPSGALAVTCSRFSNGAMVESDIRINKAAFKWTTQADAAGCSNRFGLTAVMTHEFGHAFGLGHVSEADHAALTMSTAIGPCDASASTLGLGDVRAMQALY
ncbi:matrixin family metalloprotease [Melittangium boletus]|uniref:matrixin family metalloprotease n=1 Tax=Melittangium boletus TaxID=83453 RepID=UPI003DA37853